MKKKVRIKKLPIIILGIGLIAVLLFLNRNPKEEDKSWQNTPLIGNEEVEQSMFHNSYKKASLEVSKMSIEEKVGQLFLVRYDKTKTSSWQEKNPGGYILFAKDFESHTKESIKQELSTLQKNSKYKYVLGVDEEGGFVTRVSRYPAFRNEKFASPKYYYSTGGYELLEQTEKEKATLLKSIGLNLNLAPVADVSENENDFIYSRAFGKNATETSDYIKHMVTYASESKINSCLKHFPGYGNNVDTHTGIAIDERSYENFLEKDFLPFQAGIEAGVPTILVSHNVVKKMDEQYPSSLSEKVINELRNTLGFTGIIMTDDLAMDAVKAYVENGEAATLAINAGNDMIITSDFDTMYEEVLKSVKDNKIKEDTINKAVLRIIAWKYESGIL